MDLLDLLRDVGWSGAADIGLMAVLAYVVLVWLRRTRTRSLLRAALVVLPVYLGARLADLRLVATVLEGAFVVVLISAVVLYGQEIRTIIERTASLGRRKDTIAAPADMRVLARSIFDLAREKNGALIVLEGHDPIDSLIEGGVELDGRLSEPLLKSLFHPASMGHDGALVLRHGRAQRFGCHLPLSTNFEALGHRGTRHAAGLGLSERSDALCIVVSEERGTVSLCDHGKLDTVDEVEPLLERVAHFQKGASGSVEPKRRRLYPGTFLASVLLAALSWVVLVHGARPVQRTYTARVEVVDLPPGMRAHTILPETVRVTVTGAGRDFYLIRPASVRVVVSLPNARPGSTAVNIGSSEVVLPRGLALKYTQPGQVALYLVER